MPSRTFLLAEIAAQLGGEVIDGAGVKVRSMATLASAGADDLTFFASRRHRSALQATQAGAVIVSIRDREATTLPRIVVDNPYAYYARAVELLHPRSPAKPGIHPSAVVGEGARVGEGASVGAFCYIGARAVIGARVALGPGCSIGDDASIGDDSLLHARVSVYGGCIIGQRAVIHSGAVIGSDGFGMAREGEGWRKIPQVGKVLIGNDVEIGANTTIDRGALDDTVIEDGVKLDNLIQVAHNVRIGAHSALAGCVGIAGSTQLGKRCTIGGGTVILGHLELCDDVQVGAASVVTRSILKPGEYAGLYPLQEKSEWARNAVMLRQLGALAARVGALEQVDAREPGDGKAKE